MIIRTPSCFADFVCAAGACPDTCCGGWIIDVDDTTAERWNSMEEPLRSRLLAGLDGGPGSRQMRQSAENRCVFFRKDGLCSLVAEYGEQILGEVCHMHPRFLSDFGGRQECCLSISCPEAARLLLTAPEPLQLITQRNDDPPAMTDLDPEVFLGLSACRQTAFTIIQDRNLTLPARMAVLLRFAERLQACLDTGHPERMALWRRRYDSEDYRLKRPASIRRERAGAGKIGDTRKLLLSLDFASPELPRLLEDLPGSILPAELRPEYAGPAERLLWYWTCRYFLQACEEEDLLWRVQLACMLTALCAALWQKTGAASSEAMALNAHLPAREIEHSPENLASLRAFFAGSCTAAAMERQLLSLS